MDNFRELSVWKKAVDLSTVISKMTETFPVQDQYGFTAQMRRCAVSMGSNIAEVPAGNLKKSSGNLLILLSVPVMN